MTAEWLGQAYAKQKKSKTRPVQKHFVNSVLVNPSVLPGFSNRVWYRDAQMSCNHHNSRTESHTAPTAQASAWTSTAVFLGEGGRASPQCPTALQGHADLLESAPGLTVPSSIVQHRHPRAPHCRSQRKPVPALGIQLLAPKLQMNALKTKSFLLLQFCVLFQTELRKPLKRAPHPSKVFPEIPFQAARERHTYLSLLQHYQ